MYLQNSGTLTLSNAKIGPLVLNNPTFQISSDLTKTWRWELSVTKNKFYLQEIPTLQPLLFKSACYPSASHLWRLWLSINCPANRMIFENMHETQDIIQRVNWNGCFQFWSLIKKFSYITCEFSNALFENQRQKLWYMENLE